jgi:hypothetical protein
VVAAVDEARRAALPSTVEIRLPPDAPPALAKHAGRRGRLRLVKVLYNGFERLERLVPVVVLSDSLEVIDPNIVHAIFRGTFHDLSDGERVNPASPKIDGDLLADATEEVLTPRATAPTGE